MLIYAWGSGAKKISNPMVALASFEAVEAGLKDLFEVTYDKIFKGKDGYPNLKYFDQAHIEFEVNHEEIYVVDGYPPMNTFPAEHPNRVLYNNYG